MSAHVLYSESYVIAHVLYRISHESSCIIVL